MIVTVSLSFILRCLGFDLAIQELCLYLIKKTRYKAFFTKVLLRSSAVFEVLFKPTFELKSWDVPHDQVDKSQAVTVTKFCKKDIEVGYQKNKK